MKCPKCSQTLGKIYWNSQKDMTICLNHTCPAYRNPVSTYSYLKRIDSYVKSTEDETLDALLKEVEEIVGNKSRL